VRVELGAVVLDDLAEGVLAAAANRLEQRLLRRHLPFSSRRWWTTSLTVRPAIGRKLIAAHCCPNRIPCCDVCV
jgi:hypothetical protein